MQTFAARILSVRHAFEDHGWIIAVLFIFLQTVKNLFEVPIAIMAAVGLIVLCANHRLIARHHATIPFLIVFGGIWLPMLFSLPDAADLARSAEKVLIFLRFPLAAIFLVWVMGNQRARQLMIYTIGVALTFNAIDTIVQAVCGYDLFGYPPVSNYMTGLVHHKLRGGHIMAVLSPVYFYWTYQQCRKRPWMVILAVAYAGAVLLSGSRAAWIMLAIGTVLFILPLISWQKLQLKYVGIGFVAAVAMLAVMFQSPQFSNRFQLTKGLLSADYDRINRATSLRLPIWEVGVRIAHDHWANGIGPGNFRTSWQSYVPDTYWLKPGSLGDYPLHPHLFVLEIAIETGIVGIVGFLLALASLTRLYWKVYVAGCHDTLPWLSASLVALMPFNVHFAFYATFWSCITWWIISIAFANIACLQETASCSAKSGNRRSG